jgi:phenylpropionate dioxygenase-like ring-hydroxylating dioxygenase large terminal subunit
MRRMRHLVDSGSTTLVESERHNPVSEYWDPERLRLEQQLLLGRLPVIVGHASRLATGDGIVIDTLSGRPVVACHGGDGSVRAFLRNCMDAVTGLSVSGSNRGPGVRCDEHCRQLDLQGSPTIGERQGCFLEIPVQVRHGLIWVTLAPDAPLDVAAYLCGLDDEFTSFGLDSYVYEREYAFTENLNWKSVIDGFMENYHVRFLHSESLLKYLRTNVHTYDAFGPHSRLGVLKTTHDKVKDLPVEEIEPLRYLSFVYQIFPNTILSWVGDHFDSWTSWPSLSDPNWSTSRFSMYVPADRVDEHGFWDRSAKTVLDVIPTEDFTMARIMQHGFVAAAQPFQVYGRNEGALQHYHEQLEAVLGPAPLTLG